MKITHAHTIVPDTPEEALLVSLRQALVHAHCHCTAELGRVVATPQCFWWTPSLESDDEPRIAVELEDSESEELYVEGWCPKHRQCSVAVRDLLVQARRAQKTGQRRHMWLEAG